MATKYTRGLAANFGGNLDQRQFHTEVTADGGIVPNVTTVNITGDVVDIWFDAALGAGEQTTLNTLISAHTPVAEVTSAIYDAVVDTHGNGDYLLPSAAFAAGHTSLFIRNGNYVETGNVTVPNYGRMVGETGGQVVLYFVGSYGVVADATGGSKETAGTITCTNGDATVTGTGTSFTNLAANDFILLGSNYFKIGSVTNDTSLELEMSYIGRTMSDITYQAQAMYTGVQLQNIIIYNSSSTGLYMRGCWHCSLESVSCKANSPNVLCEDCGDSSFKNVLVESGTGVGMKLDSCVSICINVADVYNNTSHGIEVIGASSGLVLDTCECSNNGAVGICVMGTGSDINLTDCVLKNNATHGFVSTNTTGAIMVDSSIVSQNGANGLQIDGCNCIVTGNIVSDNITTGIDMVSDHGVISNNMVKFNVDGIKVSGSDCIVNANGVKSNTGTGIHIAATGDDSVVTSNRCDANATGVEIMAGATDCMVTYNNLKGNTGTNLTDNGTTTDVTGNKT